MHESLKEYPISSLLTGNVRSGNRTPLDTIEDYLDERQKQLIKYAQQPNNNKLNTEWHFKRLNEVIEALNSLQRNKVEVWLYMYDCIRSVEREEGLFGEIRITLPLRHNTTKTACLDFINEKAIIWSL